LVAALVAALAGALTAGFLAAGAEVTALTTDFLAGAVGGGGAIGVSGSVGFRLMVCRGGGGVAASSLMDQSFSRSACESTVPALTRWRRAATESRTIFSTTSSGSRFKSENLM